MQINLETPESHTIQAYDNQHLQINSVIYERSVLVSREKIISDLPIKQIHDIQEAHLPMLLELHPELIIIGHSNTGVMLAPHLIASLSQQGIGVECMSVGAACRTYNILLGERRAVLGWFILA